MEQSLKLALSIPISSQAKGRNTIALDAEFESGDSPAVLTQVQTFKGGDWVTTRTDNITGESFQVMMQEEERLNEGDRPIKSSTRLVNCRLQSPI